MSTRGTIRYWCIINILDIHIYDETAEHTEEIHYVPYMAISLFNREIVTLRVGRKRGYKGGTA